MRKLIEFEASPPIKIRRDYDPSIPDINIDPELLVQVFLNIARNAMQSLDGMPNPKLTFVTRVERLFTVGSRQHKIVIKVNIIDNGPGIPDSLKIQIFKRFEKGHDHKGSGLGLAIVRSLAEKYGGWVYIEDRLKGQPEKGAKFVVVLPKA